ncbi:hypothetical protein EP10_002699 [Geobacillus icigianus]|uniref:Uncharacterized protein n=1 Tax=Geobacillus icigianus TaxID=1430331 RepID=A0ABU6BJJ1_9BACL|nr:hypothetical protein [Geobacillus icigianus]
MFFLERMIFFIYNVTMLCYILVVREVNCSWNRN